MIGFEYTKWHVSRSAKKQLLDFIVEGLNSAGCTILYASNPAYAPFLVAFELPGGERQAVLAYAFLANSVVTRNRPRDEHRFQVKYGSNPKSTLSIEQDPALVVTTVFVGIDPERKILIGADPVLHDGTRMFISIEFKRHNVDDIVRKGWHAWERESTRGNAEPVEVLVGVTQERILDFIRFERLALGLDQGHRQLLAERLLSSGRGAKSTHALIKELELPEESLFDLIHGAKRLKMAVRGWVAEVHLERLLRSVPGVEECMRLEEEGSPDISLEFRGHGPILIECKNALRDRSADGSIRVDFQRTRASKKDRCSRYYQRSDFALLAACLHSVTERWEYRFVPTSALPPHGTCLGRIQSNLRVGSGWIVDPGEALQTIVASL